MKTQYMRNNEINVKVADFILSGWTFSSACNSETSSLKIICNNIILILADLRCVHLLMYLPSNSSVAIQSAFGQRMFIGLISNNLNSKRAEGDFEDICKILRGIDKMACHNLSSQGKESKTGSIDLW